MVSGGLSLSLSSHTFFSPSISPPRCYCLVSPFSAPFLNLSHSHISLFLSLSVCLFLSLTWNNSSLHLTIMKLSFYSEVPPIRTSIIQVFSDTDTEVLIGGTFEKIQYEIPYPGTWICGVIKAYGIIFHWKSLLNFQIVLKKVETEVLIDETKKIRWPKSL